MMGLLYATPSKNLLKILIEKTTYTQNIDSHQLTKEDQATLKPKNGLTMKFQHTCFSPQRYSSKPDSSNESQADRVNSDRREKIEVIQKLKDRTHNLSSSEPIILERAMVSLESGSTLEDTLEPGRDLLRKIQDEVSFKKMRLTLGLPDHSNFEITSSGTINAFYSGKTLSFSNAFKLAPDLKDEFDTLTQIAHLTGGAVSLMDQIEVKQWLMFHQHIIPQTVAEGRKLIAFMELAQPVIPLHGSYWEMIKDEKNSLVLSSLQRAQLRRLTREYIQDQSLLELLSHSVFGASTAPFKRSEAADILEKMVASPIALTWANAYVRDLGWYGAQDNELQTDESLQLVILTSLLLNLHSKAGEQEARNHVAGFNLYALEHSEKTFAEVHTAFENHLIENTRITQRNAALAAHLLLAEAAPAFLVRELPPALLLGTAQWVEFCRIVAAQEVIAPGSTRTMTYAELHRRSSFDAMTEPQKALDALAAMDPVLDWALFNRIVTPDTVENSPKDALETAINAYARYARTAADTAETLSRPLPTRKSISRDILKQVAKGCTYLDDEVLHQKTNRSLEDAYADSFLISPVELHMSNDLITGDWDLKRGESIYSAFPRMQANLISPDGEFYRQFNREYVSHSRALHMHLKLALTALPLADRTRLLKGQVTLFSVRASVAKLQSLQPLPANVLAQTVDLFLKAPNRKPTESHKEIEAAIGRYGVVICSRFEGSVTCYELFTLHGVCRENPELAALIQRENLLDTSLRSNLKAFSLPAPIFQLPTNIEAYTHGVTPGLVDSSLGVIEKVGGLPAPILAHDVMVNGYYQSFYSTELDPLVNYVLKHCPIASYDELVRECWGQTRLEALRAKREKDLDTFLNFVVPFKSCIEDLNSDDLDRQLQGAATCALEIAMTVLLVVGAVAQIASIAARNISVATKASAMATTGLGLVSNLLNPLDGATDLLLQGEKLLRRGLSKSFVSVENAISDMRNWSGVTPRAQLKSIIDTDAIRLGTWRPAQSSQELFQVWGIRHSDEWYALNRLGEPWGAKLQNFDYKFRLPTLNWRRIMPKGYTHGYMKKAVPAAKTKLDNALGLLVDPEWKEDVRQVFKYLFGTDSDEAIQHIGRKLREMRKDLDSFTLANVSFKKANIKAVAALNVPDYKLWKQTVNNKTVNNGSIKRFVNIYSDHLDDFYRTTKYDESRVADVLIHEMSHGAPGTLDLYYGKTLDRVEYDAAPLIDLARNPEMVDPSFANPYRTADTDSFTHLHQFQSIRASLPNMIQRNPALYNADSYEVAVSLIDQIKSNPAGFGINMITIDRALNNLAADKFLGTLEINLGKF